MLLLDADPDAVEGWQHPADVVIELAEHSPCRVQTVEQSPRLADLSREVSACRLAGSEPESMTAMVRKALDAALEAGA